MTTLQEWISEGREFDPHSRHNVLPFHRSSSCDGTSYIGCIETLKHDTPQVLKQDLGAKRKLAIV